MSKYKNGDILIFDGNNINIKQQTLLNKNEEVIFDHYHPLGTHIVILLKSGNFVAIGNDIKKHFKKKKNHNNIHDVNWRRNYKKAE